MSGMSKERDEEEYRVNQVIQEINVKQQELLSKATGLKDSVIDLRKDFWDDVTVNLEDPDDVIETEASIKQQAELLSERERTHGHISEELKTLEKLKDIPYFARIDFKEDSVEEKDELYIGIASLMDQHEENFLVYDWRAPISSLYYDHSPGRADYQTVEGTVTGNMSLKRQFIIRQGELKGMFDTGVTIVDDLLQQALGNNASTMMKSIVATIQKEQNKIIRNEHSRQLIVQGVAGSGKTSAVMQRIAYLMYRYRGEVEPSQMMMFSPNPLFSSYISNVLPELGETNIKQSTFVDFLRNRIDDRLRIESPFTQAEYVLSEIEDEAYTTRMKNIQYKSSLSFMEAVDEYIDSLVENGIQFRNITLRKRVLIPKDAIAHYFYSMDDTVSLPNRMENTLKWLLKQIEKHQEIEKNKDWVMRQVELMNQEDYLDAYYKSQEGDEVDSSIEEEVLREKVVNRIFSSIKRRLNDYAFVNLTATYRNLFKTRPVNTGSPYWREICQLTEEYLTKKKLLWEDATPFAYFKDRLIGATEDRSLRYLFIDEAQDYTLFQFAYINYLYPYTRMTLLGDINQTIYSYVSDENPLLSGDWETQERITLTKSYRSTKQIVEFTSRFAPGEDEIVPFNRVGEEPELIRLNEVDLLTSIQRKINKLLNDGYESIAIICKTMQESDRLYVALKEYMDIHLIHEETYMFQKGIVILPVYLAKGIEFDGVIIPDASNDVYDGYADQALFYTACTRAMHQLVMFTVGQENRFIKKAPREFYQISTN